MPAVFFQRNIPSSVRRQTGSFFLEITGGIKWGKKGYSYRKKVNQEAVRNE